MRGRAVWADLVVVGAGALLVAAAALVGWRLIHAGVDLILGFPPLLATWMPHVGPGTPAAILIATGVAAAGPRLARRLAWRPLMWGGWALGVGWTLSLALIDGWRAGVAGRASRERC